MTTKAVATSHVPASATDDSGSQRVLALSGIAFVPLFLVGWFAMGTRRRGVTIRQLPGNARKGKAQ